MREKNKTNNKNSNFTNYFEIMGKHCYLKDCEHHNDKNSADCIKRLADTVFDVLTDVLKHYEEMCKATDEREKKYRDENKQLKRKCKELETELNKKMRKLNSGVRSPATSSSSARSSPESTTSLSKQRAKILSAADFDNKKKSKPRNSLDSSFDDENVWKTPTTNSSKEKRLPLSPLKHNSKFSKEISVESLAKRIATAQKQQEKDKQTPAKLDWISAGGKMSKDQPDPSPPKMQLGFLGMQFSEETSRRIREKIESSPTDSQLEDQRLKTRRIKQEKPDTEVASTRKVQTYENYSPELFDSQGSSVVYVEQNSKDIFTVDDVTQSPVYEKLEPMQTVSQLEHYHSDLQISKATEYTMEERQRYPGECIDCELYYDEMLEKVCADAADMALKVCDIECDGFLNRRRALQELKEEEATGKENDKEEEEEEEKHKVEEKKASEEGTFAEPREEVYVRTKLGRRKKGAHEDESEEIQYTPDGFWDLSIEPRKSKPLPLRRKNMHFESDVVRHLEEIVGLKH